jgi:hypothetical protein
MSDLIQLQHCNVFQEKSKGVKSEWQVRENISGDVLFTLPPDMTDGEVFDLLREVRFYELKAFNAGIQFQKTQQQGSLTAQNEYLKNQLAAMHAHTDQLAERVEAFTRGEA